MTEKGQVTARTQALFNTSLSSALKDSLVPEKEFWSSSKTLITLVENYFTDKNLPVPLLKFLGEGKSVKNVIKMGWVESRPIAKPAWPTQENLIALTCVHGNGGEFLK